MALISGVSLSASKVFPAPTLIFAKRYMNSVSDGIGRAELQDEVHDVEKLKRGLLFFGGDRLDEINRRCGLRCGCPEERRQGLNLVTGLNFLYVLDIGGIKQLSAKDNDD